ncbi:glycosyl hydrolase [Microbacterium sp.]|uniref:glycosyl hydrolase n=1 Tax=Microbacterium sp. TaxID=51671 RepID=UPI0028116D93|nr:glycosyl hydrolase [Microbacterium sp.]
MTANTAVRRRYRMRAATASVLGVVLALSGAVAAGAAPQPAAAGKPSRIEIADPDATARTASLFDYLREGRGDGVLFGHQQSTEYGLTFDPVGASGTDSDVNAAVGDFPAVIGWDASRLGFGSTPSPESDEQSLTETVRKIRAADRLGTIQTMSAHMDNFVTGGNYGDTSGDVVARILPGGDHNAKLNDYLDRVARIATESTDADGRAIPIIFRPFHENAGSWFWWGAAHASASQYAELFRYTVEYLRDIKDVHNLLFAYSPGGGFAGDEAAYLAAYPGDDFVDVLGIDNYDGTGGSEQWTDQIVADLGMVARIADERGKVSALTEFGMSGALKPNGQNPDLTWYTDLLEAIRADADARRIAYMMTWTNFGTDQFFVPVPATGSAPEHELLTDFREFHADPATLFAGDLDQKRVRGTKVKTVAHDAAIHVVSPTAGQRLTTTEAQVRVRISDAKVRDAWFTLNDGERQPLTFDPASGYHLGTLRVDASWLDNRVGTLTVHAELNGKRSLELSQRLALGERPAAAPGVVDDFEAYLDSDDLRSAYSSVGSNRLTLTDDPVGSGEHALALGYDFGLQSYTGLNRSLKTDWSAFGELSLWYRPDGSANKLVLQLVAGGVAYEAYPSLEGIEATSVTVPFGDFRPAPWDTGNADRRLTADDLSRVTQFNIFINHNDGAPLTGTVVFDDIRATGTGSGTGSGTDSGTAPNGYPYCASAASDPDGDGWGWENERSCVVR